MDYQEINARTIDRWIEEGWEWGKPIPHETFLAAQDGKWDVVLTPTKPVPHSWFGDLHGKKVLGLASGGGQQMPIFAALGADCTVLDYSPRQLESERLLAEREGYPIEMIRADMSKPLPFDPLTHPEQMAQLEAENDGIQFSHTIEEQIGGQLAAGFRLTDVYGDTDGIGPLHEHNIPTYWATRAVKE